MVFHHCLSLRITSLCSMGALLTGSRCFLCQVLRKSGSAWLGPQKHGLSQRSKAITDQTLSPGIFFGDAPRPLPVGKHVILCFSDPSFSSRMFFAALSELRRRSPHGLHVDCRFLQKRCLFFAVAASCAAEINPVRPVDGPRPFGPVQARQPPLRPLQKKPSLFVFKRHLFHVASKAP